MSSTKDDQSPAGQTIRLLRWKVKQLAKTSGRQGQTIHQLRAELAEVRELNSKIERGELRRLERVTQEQLAEINMLEEKLAAADQLDNTVPEAAEMSPNDQLDTAYGQLGSE